MGTGTAVAKPSPRCIAETEDGRGRQPEETRGDVYSRRQVQPAKSAMPHLAQPDLDQGNCPVPTLYRTRDRLFLVYFERIGADKTS